MVKVASVVVCLFVLAGYFFRRRPGWHARLMTAAFVLDMALLTYVEVTRKAIKTSVGMPHPFVSFHVLISVVTVGLYFRQLYTGIRSALRAGPARAHGGSGRWFMGFRVANLLTSFFVGWFVPRDVTHDKENISASSSQVRESLSDQNQHMQKENRT